MNLKNFKLLAEKRIVLLAMGILVLFSVFVFTAILSLRNIGSSENRASNQEILTPQEEKEGEEQAQADYEAGKILEDFYKSHPWYDKFPIEEKGLFIAFSPSDEEFFVGLYLEGTPSSERRNQEQLLRERALGLIRATGANPDDYKITYEAYN